MFVLQREVRLVDWCMLPLGTAGLTSRKRTLMPGKGKADLPAGSSEPDLDSPERNIIDRTVVLRLGSEITCNVRYDQMLPFLE